MNNYLLLLPILFPMITGAFLAMFKLKGKTLDYTALGIAGVTFVLTLVAVLGGDSSLTLMSVTDLLTIKLSVDNLGRMFSLLSAFMWVLAVMFSFEYMHHEGHQTRFYSFMLINLGICVGLPLAANIFTLYMFYELLTVLSLPLVIHSFSKDAMQAGKKYLMYSFFGAGLVLVGFLFLNHLNSQ